MAGTQSERGFAAFLKKKSFMHCLVHVPWKFHEEESYTKSKPGLSIVYCKGFCLLSEVKPVSDE